MTKIKINTEYITLGQFLKFANIISNGSEAKFFLLENKIFVNGEKENRRGKKLYDGYLVKINENEFQVQKE
ncbi:MAG: S4 domain-containing protein YaaA [Erysipelotrichaceae bacterium]|nr:S4 domain-containing protein YaaA [Erysipelotrichaceae bacterium]